MFGFIKNEIVFDIWLALIFLIIALPISLIFMAFLAYVDSKKEEKDG